MKIKPLIKLEIQGLNQEKIFNNFVKEKVDTFDIKRVSHSQTSFKISPKNFDKTQKILEKNQVKITKTKTLGLFNFYKNTLLRVGILIGFFACLILCFVANFFVFKIEVLGNELIKTEQIIEYLATNDIKLFCAKSALNTETMKLELLENFDKISMVSVIQKGSSLIINIKEKSENDEYLSGNYENIVSNFNGRITKLQLVSGTALKKVGDLIKIGDILVLASYVDSSGNTQNIKADAIITAEVWYESRIIHYDSVIKTQPTGEKTQFYEISLMGLTIFSNKENIKYQYFEETITEKQFSNSILPLRIKYYTYIELATIEIVTDFQKVKNTLIDNCRQNALQQVAENDIITNENCTITEEFGSAKICYLVTVNKIL
ncbi:MAG: sporulation protein YqfD [Clostridia bacterium]|nr:sporulation protein YqfD [Clostridia bacterium]